MGDPQSFPSSTMGDTGGAAEDVVVQTRKLLDVPTAGDHVKKLIDDFFLNQTYGSFSINVLADIFVRFFVFIFTALALRCWCRAKKRSIEEQLQEQQQCLDDLAKSYERFSVRMAATCDSQRSSTPAPSVPGDQVQENSLGERSPIPILEVNNAGRSPANSTNALPTELEKVPKRRNGFVHDSDIPDRSPSLELGSSSRCRTVPSQTGKVETGGEVVIDILPVQGVFPDSATMETGNKFKKIMKDKVGVPCEHDISSSRIMQARVRVTDENLRALREVAIEGMKLDRGFTLQIGGSFLYYCNGNPEEPVLLSLRDVVKVPTVLRAEYSAGVLTIIGKHLEGAEIRAATFDGYMTLNCIKQDQINNKILAPPERRIEVWRCTDLLPPVNLDQIQIFACKAVLIEGHDVTVRSVLSSIQNTTLRTVIRNWVPTAIVIMFLSGQAKVLLASLFNLVKGPLHISQAWLFYPVLVALAIYIIQKLPPSLEDNIKGFLEQFKLTISSFQVLPNVLSSPAFFMRNGYCFQRGAKYLINYKSIFKHHHHRKSHHKQGMLDLEGDSDLEEDSDLKGDSDLKRDSNQQKGLPHLLETHKIPPSSRDWMWPCFKEVYSKKKDKNVIEKFDPNSRPKLHDSSDPFTVTYGQELTNRKYKFGLPHEYIPGRLNVKLYSKRLQAVAKNLLGAKLRLSETYGKVQAKDLFILYINGDLEKEIKKLEMEANDPFVPDDQNEGECLDMFHLIRFLRKEYEETMTQYDRMLEAGVVSWDMLWTLIVPKADVIYYCDVSKEERCGRVSSTNYNFTSRSIREPEKTEFQVELEVYDYNLINFEVQKIKRVVFPFKDEVKISDMDIYPLQYKANPQEAEEFFLTRGRKFYDLVLKYERRFMQYQGLLYSPPIKSDSKYSSSQQWNLGNKESVDGRVMLDQGVFAKMKPNMSMSTAEPSRGSLQGTVSKMARKAMIDEFDPMLKYAPAIAYGFSFSVRKWGCFTIDGISTIQFISSAFDTLVMNEDIKNTLLTLTEYHIKQAQGSQAAATNVDPLPNKGKGCIVLLHGAPGTGKTLTVESLAEKLECPLWQLSVPTIFSRTEELETNLLRTFEIAASWRAILVLDEADVYLSSRKYSPLSSNVQGTNEMTGVFLRVLEYYTGILFLTTNVVDSIEPAIYSRMSLFVKYEEFSMESRKQLWISFLNRIGFQNPSREFWEHVLPKKFNGRVIRNIIQNAQILAQSKGASLSAENVLTAFDVMATPSAMSHLIQSEDKPDPKEASTTVPTHAPSVVTDSTLSQIGEEE